MRFPFLFAALLAGSWSAAAAQQAWTGDPAAAKRELEAQYKQIAQPSPTTGIRGVFRFALEAAGVGWAPERIEPALALARSMQDLDPASKTHGNFRWRRDHAGVFDQNAVEFSMQQAGLLRLRYAKALTPGGLHQLDALLTDAIDGMHRHTVKVEYTNIFVMKSWNLISVGEALGRADVADEGYRQFDEWLAWTARHGITEFGAVTYYGTDLDSLALIAKFASRPEGRAKAEAALHYLWTDIAANWWAPGDRLGGANARSYDYLYGGGYLEAHTWTAGWLRRVPDLEGAGWLPGPRSNLLTMRQDCTWGPPAALTDPIRSQLPRIVAQRWGSDTAQRAIHYLGHSVSLASSGTGHGSDDRTLVANLGDGPKVAQMVLFMDGRGDPYGTRKEENKASQAKALHLTPFIATVQSGPELLQVLSDEPMGPKSKRKPGDLACFLSQFTLPAQAEVWVGDARVLPGTATQPYRVPTGATVCVRLGNAVVGVRFPLVVATDGKPAEIDYISDGEKNPARRLTVVHARGEPKGRGTTVVWVRATERLDDAAFAAWRNDFTTAKGAVTMTGNVLTAEVAGTHGSLRIEADVVKGERRVLQGGEPEAVLSVNGRDLGREILGKFAK